MKSAVAAPLAVQLRGQEVESVHMGHLVVVDLAGRILLSRGSPDVRVFARSALKPVQALPVFLVDAADAFRLPDEALAVALASHSGEPTHQAAVKTLLTCAGLTEEALQCGIHAPYHAETAFALARDGLKPTVLHCNCSGKHAAMLATCRYQGWDLETYRDAEHPLQSWIRELLAQLAGIPTFQIAHAVDGCGVPAWQLPLGSLARSFAKLGTPDELEAPLRAAAQRVTGLMASYPHMIAGEGRLDTDLLAAAGGQLFCKIGGEGVHAGGIRGTGLGWAIKIADGNKRALGPALARALAQVGHGLPDGAALRAHTAPIVTNNLGQPVGRLEAAW